MVADCHIANRKKLPYLNEKSSNFEKSHYGNLKRLLRRKFYREDIFPETKPMTQKPESTQCG